MAEDSKGYLIRMKITINNYLKVILQKGGLTFNLVKSSMFLLFVTVPVTNIIVFHLAAIPAMIRIGLQMGIDPMVLQSGFTNKTFSTI